MDFYPPLPFTPPLIPDQGIIRGGKMTRNSTDIQWFRSTHEYMTLYFETAEYELRTLFRNTFSVISMVCQISHFWLDPREQRDLTL